MGILGRTGPSAKFVYSLHVHALSPWSSGTVVPLVVGWQRGEKKKGTSRPVLAMKGVESYMVVFDEEFEVDVTLFKDKTAPEGPFGPFDPKTITLSVHEAVASADGGTVANEIALGRVIINLTEFVGLDQAETRAFPMRCNTAIHEEAGDPMLAVTIRCQWMRPHGKDADTRYPLSKGVIRAAGRGGEGSAPVMVDTNLMQFFHYKYADKDPSGLEEFNPMAIASTAAVATLAKSALQQGGTGVLSKPPRIIQSRSHGSSERDLAPMPAPLNGGGAACASGSQRARAVAADAQASPPSARPSAGAMEGVVMRGEIGEEQSPQLVSRRAGGAAPV
ncbi:hypothetical protein FOA52_015402 [Chlamydomonas sp. UWO 241]|nr:hypothetical protein FOA52_015402 [Chlamydomonas sp. UWO 241]